MGMYTTIWNSDRTKSWQIKCGWDGLEEFRIGDQVPWRISPDYPGQGYLLDGVYDGCGDDDAFIVIKDHRIAHIEPMVDRDEDPPFLSGGQFDQLVEIWKPVEFERSWWSEEAWAKKEAYEIALRKRLDEQREKNRCRKDHRHDFGCAMRASWPRESLEELFWATCPFFAAVPK